MSTDTRTARATRVPMDPMRKTALAAGLLYIATFVTSIPALPLYHDILEKPGYLLSGASDTGVLWGAFLEIFCGLTGIGTAVVLHRVLKRESDTAALGFVTSRVLEAAMIFSGVLSVLTLVTLHQDATVGQAGQLATTSQALIAFHDWTFLLGPGYMPVFNALCLGYVLYRTRLVPRALPVLGFVGAAALFASSTGTLFGLHEQVSTTAMVMALPIATWEFSLGVYLTVKGFRPSPVLDGSAAPVAPPQHALAA